MKEYVGAFLWYRDSKGKLVISVIEKNIEKLYKKEKKKCQK